MGEERSSPFIVCNFTFLNMTSKLDPDERVLEKLFKEETKKREDKKLDDQFHYDTNSK